MGSVGDGVRKSRRTPVFALAIEVTRICVYGENYGKLEIDISDSDSEK